MHEVEAEAEAEGFLRDAPPTCRTEHVCYVKKRINMCGECVAQVGVFVKYPVRVLIPNSLFSSFLIFFSTPFLSPASIVTELRCLPAIRVENKRKQTNKQANILLGSLQFSIDSVLGLLDFDFQ